jgi:MOSC domain-containing protein YiiM
MIIKTVFGHVFETDIICHIAVKFKAFPLITSALLHITLQVQNCIKLEDIISAYFFFSVFDPSSVTGVYFYIIIRKSLLPKNCVLCIDNR